MYKPSKEKLLWGTWILSELMYRLWFQITLEFFVLRSNEVKNPLISHEYPMLNRQTDNDMGYIDSVETDVSQNYIRLWIVLEDEKINRTLWSHDDFKFTAIFWHFRSSNNKWLFIVDLRSRELKPLLLYDVGVSFSRAGLMPVYAKKLHYIPDKSRFSI